MIITNNVEHHPSHIAANFSSIWSNDFKEKDCNFEKRTDVEDEEKWFLQWMRMITFI